MNLFNDSMIIVFKTSVQFDEDAEHLGPFINEQFPDSSWNFDLNDRENIFRIEGSNLSSSKIIKVFEGYGYHCEELARANKST